MIYSGLTKVLGKPRDLEKNLEDPKYFNENFDISIPIEDTNEYAKFERNKEMVKYCF